MVAYTFLPEQARATLTSYHNEKATRVAMVTITSERGYGKKCAGLPWGGGDHGHPLSLLIVKRRCGRLRGGGVVVSMALSTWRWASCLIWGRMVDVTAVASATLPKHARATPVNPRPSWRRQLVSLMAKGTITLGSGVIMATLFSRFIVERGEEGGALACLGREMEATIVTSTFFTQMRQDAHLHLDEAIVTTTPSPPNLP